MDAVRQAAEEVGACVVDMLLKDPFFAHLLSGVPRRVFDRIPTAAVALTSGGVELWVNPTFFMEELSGREERVAVIKHEALHLMFKHLLRIEEEDRLLSNIAADLVVNQFVEPWPLPESAVTLATFPDLELKPDGSLEYYYGRLKSLREEMEQRGAGGQGEGEEGEAGGQGGGGAGEGEAGQGGGEEGAGGSWAEVSAPKSAEALERLGATTWHSDHSAWAMGHEGEEDGGWGQAVSDSMREAAKAKLEGHIERVKERAGPKAWGELPGPLREVIRQMIELRKPKVSWRRALRLFTNSSKRTRIVATSRKLSKRFDTFPGIRVKRYQRVAVVLDTSGSISEAEVSEFFSEVDGIWREGAEVEVIECDAAVQRAYAYTGKLPEGVAGGGGTAFDPAFEYMRAQRMVRYDACIYLTDGYAATPKLRAPCKTLWCISAGGTTDFWEKGLGRVVRLE